MAYSKIAGVLVSNDRLEEAIEAFRACILGAEKLADQDHGKTPWRHSLGLNYERMGDLLSKVGRVDQAIKYFQKSLAIREELADDRKATSKGQELSP